MAHDSGLLSELKMANRFELGHRAWPILAASAANRRTLYYGELATALGYRGARVVRAALWPIQDYCLEKGLPPLTSIVINKHAGVPGRGFIASSGDLQDDYERVFRHDWVSEQIPFPPGTLLTSRPGRSARSSVNPQTHVVPDFEVRINGRGPYQNLFRKSLFNVYGGQCALCDTRHPAFLVASHIVPWAENSQERLNPRNGILLCRTHDAAFETGLLSVHPDLSVEFECKLDSLGRDLWAHLRSTATRLRVTRLKRSPDTRFLEWRLLKNPK
jgi:putative restriction endonuclease